MTGEYESDGKLAFIEFDINGVAYAYLFDGTYLKYKGQKIIEEKESVIMKRLIERHRHFLMYVLIGAIATAVDMLIFFLLSDVLGLHYITSNIISVFVGIFTSFELNSRFNFRKTNLRVRRLISFTIVCLLGMAMGSLLLALFYSQLGIPKYVAKILSVILAGVFQYLFNKNITFKK